MNIKNRHNLTIVQKGFSPIIIIVLIAAGILAGTVAIQNGVNFLPKAAEQGQTGTEGDIDETGEKCSQPVVGRCNGETYITEVWEWDNSQCKLRFRSQVKPETCPVEKTNPETPKSENNPNQNTPESNPNQNPKDQEVLHPVDSQKMQACGSNNDCRNALCEADEVVFCDNRNGSPRAIRKSGGYYDSSHPLKDANGCVFDYFEVSSKNSECGKSVSKSGDVVFVTEKEAEEIDKERSRTLPERERQSQSGNPGQAGSPGQSTNPKETTACSPEAAKTYNDAKVANNLARFYAIRNGAGGLCVPADLGVPEKDDVTVDGVEGRLMMCSSKDNPPKLYWMIASYKDSSLIQVPESQKTAPDANTIEGGFKNLQKARCAAGLDSGPKCS